MASETMENKLPPNEKTPPSDTEAAEAKDPLAEALAKIQALEQKEKELNNKYLYLYADFENFRRRNEQDRINFRKFGHEHFLKDLLQILDNFERAIQHAKSEEGGSSSKLANVIQGVEMTHHQLLETLKSQGVKEIKAVGAKFDPSFHEAVGEEENGGAEPGHIVKEAQKGYMLHDRLLRAAKVIVAK